MTAKKSLLRPADGYRSFCNREELLDDVAELADGCGGVDSGAEMAAVVKALRIPAHESSNFVNYPAFSPEHWRLRDRRLRDGIW